MKATILTTIVALALPGLTQAAPFTFFGENTSPAATVSGDPLTARTAFLGTLSSGVGTEDFEGSSGGAPIALTFPGSTGSITATLSGSPSVVSGLRAGRFATSGSNYIETPGGGDFEIDFSTGISAFGFYGTDLGDVSNNLVIGLRDAVTAAVTEITLTLAGAPSGSLIFWGFTDTTNSYDQITFDNTPGSGDFFGFDDMTVGDVSQITNPPAVPLPAAGWLLIAGLGGMGLMRRKQTRQS